MENQQQPQKSDLISSIKKFFHERPFIAWNIFTLISLFIHPLLAVVFFFVSLIFWTKRKKELEEQRRQQLITEANQYIEEIKSKKAIPIIKSSIFLKEGESVFLEESTDLQETRAVRTFSGGSRGVGFRVAKGISVRAGGFSGTSESNQKWKALDTGNLIITNQRLIFNGSKENRSFPIKKILSVETFIESIRISIDGRAKSLSFPVQNPYIWSTVINIVCSTKNPLKLDDIKLDIILK
jgi:hypothetical protein